MLPGDVKTCTITNNDIQPQLIVIKHVVNNDGGSLGASAFTIHVTGNAASPASFPGAESPGTTVMLNTGSYSVTEDPVVGYASSLSADCSGSIGVGQVKTCTITNDDVGPVITSPRDLKQAVLNDLKAMRATVTDKKDIQKLDEAIKHLTKSLDASLWLDDIHLNPKKGQKVFQEEKDAIVKLLELIKDKKSTVDKGKLQDFINRLLKADRTLASGAINDVVAAGGDAKKIKKANEELGKGDQDASKGNFANAIEHYRNAWDTAQQAYKTKK